MMLVQGPTESDEAFMIRRDDAARQELLMSDYDGLDVLVMSKFDMYSYEPGDNEVCISISSKQWDKSSPPRISDKFVDVLRLQFDDVDVGDFGMTDGKTISHCDADRVIKFVQQHLNKNKLVIHCFAGISRSRSMAGTLSKLFGFMPNVYTIRSEAVRLRIEGAFERVMNGG